MIVEVLYPALLAQLIRKLPAVPETWVRSLGWEDALEEGMVTHSVSLLEQFHGQRTLTGYSPRSRKQLDRTEQRTLSRSKRIAVYLVVGLKHLIQESMSFLN